MLWGGVLARHKQTVPERFRGKGEPKLKVKGLKLELGKKETGRISCSETQGNCIYPGKEENLEWRQGWGRAGESGHGRVHIQIKPETEHKAQQNSKEEDVDCRELSAEGGRQGKAEQPTGSHKKRTKAGGEGAGKKQGGTEET